MAAGLRRFDAALPELRANWRCLWDFVTLRGDELPADVSCFGDGSPVGLNSSWLRC